MDRRRVLHALIEEERGRRIGRGVPILDEDGLAADVEAAVLRAERSDPRFLARAAARLRAEAQGRRLTGCRLVRGTHGGTHVFDPEGTDDPPEWWNVSVAMRAARARPRVDADVAAARAADADAAREAVVAILARLRERSQPPEVRGVTPQTPGGGRSGGRRLALG